MTISNLSNGRIDMSEDIDKSQSSLMNRIATELSTPEHILARCAAEHEVEGKCASTVSPSPRIAPRTQIEDRVFQLWVSVLRFSSFGVDDDFFELGGHS